MPKTSIKPVDADTIAEMADRGEDISAHFTNQFTVVRPAAQRVNVDFTTPMLNELDREAETLNISRQAIIKTMLREGSTVATLHNRDTGPVRHISQAIGRAIRCPQNLTSQRDVGTWLHIRTLK